MSSNLLDQLYSERDDLLTALKAAKGYMMNVMIDLETLSPYAGGIILSIGAVKFDPRDARANISTFHVGIDIQSSQDADMTISASTLMI